MPKPIQPKRKWKKKVLAAGLATAIGAGVFASSKGYHPKHWHHVARTVLLRALRLQHPFLQMAETQGIQKGVQAPERKLLKAIMLKENRFLVPNKVNRNRNSTKDYGLSQINTLSLMDLGEDPDNPKLLHAKKNVSVFIQKFLANKRTIALRQPGFSRLSRENQFLLMSAVYHSGRLRLPFDQQPFYAQEYAYRVLEIYRTSD